MNKRQRKKAWTKVLEGMAALGLCLSAKEMRKRTRDRRATFKVYDDPADVARDFGTAKTA